MATASTRSNPTRTISLADLQQAVDDQVASLDPARASSLDDLATVRAAKAATLTGEQKLLALKYGADDPRLASVTARIAHNAALQQDLATEAVRTRTPAPEAGAQSYIFHGYVLDPQQKPLPQLTVALYDDKNQWVRQLGFGCTDNTGYFLLRYDQGQSLRAPAPTPPPPPTPAPPAKGAAASLSGNVNPINVVTDRSTDFVKTTPSLSILVFDQKQNLLYRDPQPLQPKLGEVDYRVIVIGGTPGTCMAPPASTPPPGPEKKTPPAGSATPAAPATSGGKPAAPTGATAKSRAAAASSRKRTPAVARPSTRAKARPKKGKAK